jgi:hypothetical protein
MNKYVYPARIELEVCVNGDWLNMLSFVVNSKSALQNKMMILKCMYVTKNKYRIFVYLNSKVNTYIE